MGRIRSIKPEFWQDDKIAALKNKLAGYFFISLWNQADDEGKFKWNPKALSLHAPIFRTKEIVTYLSELSQVGLIQKSECSQWGLITKWKHQKIDKPRVPDVKAEEIHWLPLCHSPISRDHSTNVRRKDRIGKDRDRIGKDHASLEHELPLDAAEPIVLNLQNSENTNALARGKNPDVETPSKVLIAYYCELWKIKHGNGHGNPLIDGKSAGIAKMLVKDFGLAKAKSLIEAYLSMPERYFEQKRHDLATLKISLAAVSQFMATGKVLSETTLQQRDKTLANKSAVEDVIASFGGRDD